MNIKQKLERDHAMTFRVTEEERELIRQRQAQTGIMNTRAYLLKMALNGRIIRIELDSVKEMCRLLGNYIGNINQIAKKVNETDNIYNSEIEEIKASETEIMKQQREILHRLNKILETVK